MAFEQDMLRPAITYTKRRAYRLYYYKTTDTTSEIVSVGYFSPNDWVEFQPGDIIHAHTGNGYAFFEVSDDISTVVQIPVSSSITDPTLHTGDFVITSLYDRYRTDTSGGPIVVTIQPDFPIYDHFRVQDVGASWTGVDTLTVDFVASGYLYQGISQNYVGNIPNDGESFIYMGPDIGFELL